MKIIDSHLHYGRTGPFDMNISDVLDVMRKYSVDIGILSNIEAAEYYEDYRHLSSISINNRLLEEISDIHNLYMLYWISPAKEQMSEEIEAFIQANRSKIVGFKIHPFLSGMPVTDPRMQPYLRAAERMRLPVAVHTAKGHDCESDYLSKLCAMYEDIDFIAVHMDLASDHKKAVEYVNSIPNLYGDMSWIEYNDFKHLNVNRDKVLFGSDIPINKQVDYSFYKEYFNEDTFDADLMARNALSVFGLQDGV